MRFKKWPQLPGAGRTRAGHHHGSHTPTSPEAVLLGKIACQPKHFGRLCTCNLHPEPWSETLIRNFDPEPWSRTLIRNHDPEPWCGTFNPEPWSGTLIRNFDPEPWSGTLIRNHDPEPWSGTFNPDPWSGTLIWTLLEVIHFYDSHLEQNSWPSVF